MAPSKAGQPPELLQKPPAYKRFPSYKQIPNIVSPPVEAFAGPDKSPKIAAVGNDEIKKIVEAHPEAYEGFVAGIP